MLPISERSPHRDGYYLSGTYSLAVVRKNNGWWDATNPIVQYEFSPKPTDIDTMLNFPNDVQPDQSDGVFVTPSGIGTGTVAILGHTGQFPERIRLATMLGASGAGIASAVGAAIPSVDGQQALGNRDGYALWMALYNLFAIYDREIKENPYERAMLFFNHKDLEFYHVVPMSFHKVRQSAAPLRYNYDIQLQVLGEFSFTQQVSWSDRASTIRSDINRWKQLIDRSILLASSFAQNSIIGVISAGYNPFAESIASMSAGLQSLKFTGDVISKVATSAATALIEPSELMYSAELDKAYQNTPRSFSTYGVPGHLLSQVVPPTREAIRSVYERLHGTMPNTVSILGLTLAELSTGGFDALTSQLYLDDALLDIYETVLDLTFTGYLAEDLAPLSDFSPAHTASMDSSDMHRTSRNMAASIITGREDEFASTILAGDTEFVGGVRSPRTTTSRDLSEHNLTYLAAKILPSFVVGGGTEVPGQLESFRRAFLGMRDPTKISTYYKTVTIKSTDTIYSLAREHLGTWTRWAEIALINGLQYPYISERTGPYQAGVGDVVYIPSADSKVPAEVIEQLLNIAKVHDLVSLQSLFLGLDWQISESTGDFVFSEYDLAHVAGVDAFAQEIALVFEGSGGVTADSYDIVPIKVGTKSRGVYGLTVWRTLLANWLKGDPRVAEVKYVRVEQSGDAITFSAGLKFEHYDENITVSSNLRI